MIPKERARSSGRVTLPMKLIQTGIVNPMMIHEPPQPRRSAEISTHAAGRAACQNQSASSR